MSAMDTCKCREYREVSPGVCSCTHTRNYHKRNVGPCWYPTQMKGTR
jgi:hypothetical protein